MASEEVFYKFFRRLPGIDPAEHMRQGACRQRLIRCAATFDEAGPASFRSETRAAEKALARRGRVSD